MTVLSINKKTAALVNGRGMRNQVPLRIQKGYDRYEVKTGSAGFVQLIKNGKRIAPKDTHIVFNLRRQR